VNGVKRLKACFLCAFLLLLTGCFLKETETGGCSSCPSWVEEKGTSAVAFETVDQGVHSGIREARRLVIKNPADWEAFWREHTKDRLFPLPLPYVNFAEEMVIAYFLGEQKTSGYTVEIFELREMEGEMLVRIRVTTPPPGIPLLQVLTQPFHIIKLSKRDLPVRFEVEVSSGKAKP